MVNILCISRCRRMNLQRISRVKTLTAAQRRRYHVHRRYTHVVTAPPRPRPTYTSPRASSPRSTSHRATHHHHILSHINCPASTPGYHGNACPPAAWVVCRPGVVTAPRRMSAWRTPTRVRFPWIPNHRG